MLKIAILFSLFSVALSACNKDENDDASDQNQETTTSSYTLIIDGVTATEVVGEISVCNDGYFFINGKTPDGNNMSLNTSKIMVDETRSICDFQLEAEEFTSCVDDGGFNIGGTIFTHHFSPVSGTATRTSTNNLSVTGVLMQIDDLTEHAFTLEATAGLVSPVNCE